MGLYYSRAIDKFLTNTCQESAEQKCITGHAFITYRFNEGTPIEHKYTVVLTQLSFRKKAIFVEIKVNTTAKLV